MPAKAEIYVYFGFTPKYRKDLLTDEVKNTIQWAINDQASQMNIEIIALSTRPDHLYLVTRLPPEISVAKAAQMLKWRSSYVARRRHHELRQIRAFWGKHYFASSISPRNLEKARQYVESR